MPAPPARDVTQLLVAWCGGDQTALGRLVPRIYAELRQVAHRQLRGERRPHDLQTTALVNEAYLCRIDPRKARVVELRYFGGLSVEETAEVLAVSADTVIRDWRMAKLWLRREVRRAGARPRSRPS